MDGPGGSPEIGCVPLSLMGRGGRMSQEEGTGLIKAWSWDTEVQKAESGTRPLLYWEGAHSSEMGQAGGPQRKGL